MIENNKDLKIKKIRDYVCFKVAMYKMDDEIDEILHKKKEDHHDELRKKNKRSNGDKAVIRKCTKIEIPEDLNEIK